MLRKFAFFVALILLNLALGDQVLAEDEEQEDDLAAFAMKRVPTLHFDQNAYTDEACFPDEALEENDNKCKNFNENSPLYFDIQECENHRKLIWWFWYGYQKRCHDGSGPEKSEHGNDWEHITLNYKKIDDNWQFHSVTYYQHEGWYTRCSDIDEFDVQVFVGKNSHGSYYKRCEEGPGILFPDFCQGTCQHYDDMRNTNSSLHAGWRTETILHVDTVKGRLRERIDSELYFSPAKKNTFNDGYGQLHHEESCDFAAPECKQQEPVQKGELKMDGGAAHLGLNNLLVFTFATASLLLHLY